MKKLFIIAACAVLSLTASAQNSASSSSFFSTEKADKPITFGVRIGGNLSTITGDMDDAVKSRFGFNVGVNVDIPLLQSLYVQTGLYATQKGFKGDGYEMKANPLYLEIPVLASYRYNFSEATQLQVNFGPYLAYGISGKLKTEDEDEKLDVDFFDDNVAKKFDAGLQIGAGVTVSKFYIGCAYQFGLTSIFDMDGVGMKNSNFMFNVGYNF